jgi:uncharacterized protein (TIGR02117 family)
LKRVLHALWRGLKWLALVIVAFILAAVLFALFPVSGTQQQAGNEPPVYVCATFVHTDIAVPLNDPDIDWRALLGTAIPQNAAPDSYLLFGWGDRVFFTQVPDWGSVKPSIALSALLGLNDTAVRLTFATADEVKKSCLPNGIDRSNRQKLTKYIEASFERSVSGEIMPTGDGTPEELYFHALGRYSPFNTCNEWTADGLILAGVSQAWFAPFHFGVTWPLK